MEFTEEDLDRMASSCMAVEDLVPLSWHLALVERSSKKRKNCDEPPLTPLPSSSTVDIEWDIPALTAVTSPTSEENRSLATYGATISSTCTVLPSVANYVQTVPASTGPCPKRGPVVRTKLVTKEWCASRLQSVLKSMAAGVDDGGGKWCDAADATPRADNVSGVVYEGATSVASDYCGANGVEGAVVSSEDVEDSGPRVPPHLVDHVGLCRRTESATKRSSADTRLSALLQKWKQKLPKPFLQPPRISFEYPVTPTVQQLLKEPAVSREQESLPQAEAQAFLRTLKKNLPLVAIQTTLSESPQPKLCPSAENSPQDSLDSFPELGLEPAECTPQVPPSDQQAQSSAQTYQREEEPLRASSLPSLPKNLCQTTANQHENQTDRNRLSMSSSESFLKPASQATEHDTVPRPNVLPTHDALTCDHFDEMLELKSQIQKFRSLYLRIRKRNRVLGQCLRRYRSQREKLERSIGELRKLPLMVDHTRSLHGHAKAGAELLKRHQMKLNGDPVPLEYPLELRLFATVLYGYSYKAYEYVRTVFCDCLPSVSSVRKWNLERLERAASAEKSVGVIEEVLYDGCRVEGGCATEVPDVASTKSWCH